MSERPRDFMEREGVDGFRERDLEREGMVAMYEREKAGEK